MPAAGERVSVPFSSCGRGLTGEGGSLCAQTIKERTLATVAPPVNKSVALTLSELQIRHSPASEKLHNRSMEPRKQPRRVSTMEIMLLQGTVVPPGLTLCRYASHPPYFSPRICATSRERLLKSLPSLQHPCDL